MSGVQGPLETRAKTTVETALALEGLDATPWDSGELAYVRSTGATYELVREDLTMGPSTFDSIAVGPTGSVGRWVRVCFTCSGGTSGSGITGPTGPTGPTGGLDVVPNIEDIVLTTDETTNSNAYSTLLSLSVTNPDLIAEPFFIHATVAGSLSAGSAGLSEMRFAVIVDGEVAPVQGQSFAIEPADVNEPQNGALGFIVSLAPGVHTVALQWAVAGIGAAAQINAATDVAEHMARLSVFQIH